MGSEKQIAATRAGEPAPGSKTSLTADKQCPLSETELADDQARPLVTTLASLLDRKAAMSALGRGACADARKCVGARRRRSRVRIAADQIARDGHGQAHHAVRRPGSSHNFFGRLGGTSDE